MGFGLMPLGSVVGVGFLCWLWNMSGFPLAPNFTRFPIHYPWLWTWSFPLFCGFVMALIGLVTVYYCRHCLQAGLGKRWIWAMGGLLALHGLCLHIDSRQVVNLESPPVVLRDEKTALHGKISITFLPPTDLASGSRPMDLSGALSVFKVRHPIKGAPDEILVLKPGENPGYNPGDEWVPADNVMLSDQIAAGWADIQQRQLFEAEDFLSEPGWTASVHPLSTEKYPRSFQKFISSNVEFGHFVWLGEETIQAPLPTLAYGWPRLASNGGWPSWINAALPLLIVAVMLACQKRTGQRLQVDLACANLTAV
ncbi:MAG TPA: hypothetical protein VHC95_07400 [Opitutales bacterium]|nr:hypothetical protein [Opitutales bacterium]